MHALFTQFRGFTDDPRTDRIEKNFLRSPTLKSIYDSTVKPLMQTLKEDVEKVTFRNPFAEGGYALPLETACSDLPPRNSKHSQSKMFVPLSQDALRHSIQVLKMLATQTTNVLRRKPSH